MEVSKITSKGQTVIPKAVRDALCLGEGTALAWSTRDGVMIVVPVPRDPIQASVGMLKDVAGLGTAELLADRREDLVLEEQKAQRLGWNE